MKRLEATKKLEEKQLVQSANTASASAATQAATTATTRVTVLPPRLDKVAVPPPAGSKKQKG